MTAALAPVEPDLPSREQAVVANSHRILFEREIAGAALGPARCYAARGLDFPGEPGFVAWVVPRAPGPKTTHLRAQRGLEDPIWSLVAHGPVARGDRQEYAVVYPRPLGRADRRHFGRYSANHLVTYFLRPAIKTLRDLRVRRLVHGHIHPDNLFHIAEEPNRLALGPSGVLPDGAASGRGFQPVERAMADPLGRGPASPGDDMFSLGMTLYAICSGAVIDDGDEMMRRRLAFGTASSLIQPKAVPVGLHELIEGLIADDPAARWTLDELGEAIGGRRPPRTLSSSGDRALPPLQVGGMTVQSRDEMLWAMSVAPDAGARLLRDGTIASWLANAARAQPVPADDAKAGYAENELAERTVATAIATMAPRLPVPFGGIRFAPGAFGTLLRMAFDDPALMKTLVEFVRSPLLDTWIIASETASHTDAAPLREIRQFRKTLLESPEFALYRLDPDAPCMAKAGKGAWLEDVAAVSGLIDASCAAGAGRPDGHLVAFLAARAKLDDELFADPAHAAGTFATACTYIDACAAIQHAAGRRPMPNLARTLGPCVDKVLSAFRSPAVRDALALESAGLLDAGDLVGLADRLLDTARHTGDEHAFMRAKGTFDAYRGLVEKSAQFRAETARTYEAQSREYVLAVAALCAAVIVLGTFYLLIGGVIFPPAPGAA